MPRLWGDCFESRPENDRLGGREARANNGSTRTGVEKRSSSARRRISDARAVTKGTMRESSLSKAGLKGEEQNLAFRGGGAADRGLKKKEVALES